MTFPIEAIVLGIVAFPFIVTAIIIVVAVIKGAPSVVLDMLR